MALLVFCKARQGLTAHPGTQCQMPGSWDFGCLLVYLVVDTIPSGAIWLLCEVGCHSPHSRNRWLPEGKNLERVLYMTRWATVIIWCELLDNLLRIGKSRLLVPWWVFFFYEGREWWSVNWEGVSSGLLWMYVLSDVPCSLFPRQRTPC